MRKLLIFLFLLLSFPLFAIPFWYKTQHFTGSKGANCGPASTAMIIYYSTGVNISVQRVRMEIGLKESDGATGFDELENNMEKHHANFLSMEMGSIVDLDNMVSNDIVMVLVNLSRIPDKSNLGQGLGNHYLIISGIEGNNYIIQDPWNGPDLRLNKKVVWKAMISRRVTVAYQQKPIFFNPFELPKSAAYY